METFWHKVIENIITSGIGMCLLAVGIWWLNKDRDKAVKAFTEEREKRINALEDSSRRCADDRVELHRQVSILQAEVRDFMKRMIEVASRGDCKGNCITGKQ